MPLVALNDRWAFGLPMKTASQSLVTCLAPSTFGRHGDNMAAMHGDWHGTRYEGAGERLMVVRNPYERLASLYWFSFERTTAWLTGEGGPLAWLGRLIARRDGQHEPEDRDWLSTQAEFAAEFKPARTFRLEDGLAAPLSHVGYCGMIPHTNQTPGRKSYLDTFGDCRLADAFCAPDMEAFYR